VVHASACRRRNSALASISSISGDDGNIKSRRRTTSIASRAIESFPDEWARFMAAHRGAQRRWLSPVRVAFIDGLEGVGTFSMACL
jgi:hypothetical protein